MRHLLPIVFLCLLTACQESDEVFVRGIPTLESNGQTTLLECVTNAKYDLDVIASNPYFKFMNEVEKMESKPDVKIVIDVVGKKEPKKPLLLKNLLVVNFSSGNC